MPDGTIYAGVSPDTGKAIYTTPSDVPIALTFNQAAQYGVRLDAHGHKDWRVPTKAELDVLFNNRAAIGGFDVSGSQPAGLYWSSSCYDDRLKWYQRLSDGGQGIDGKQNALSVRCVR